MHIYTRFSWIHVDDLVNLIYESLTNPAYRGNSLLQSSSAMEEYMMHGRCNQSIIHMKLLVVTELGVINGTAPNPVRLSEMCERLGQVVGRPSWLPVPEFALKAVLGEGASVVLEGQKVLPVKANQLGFSFRYPYVGDALRAIAKDL